MTLPTLELMFSTLHICPDDTAGLSETLTQGRKKCITALIPQIEQF